MRMGASSFLFFIFLLCLFPFSPFSVSFSYFFFPLFSPLPARHRDTNINNNRQKVGCMKPIAFIWILAIASAFVFPNVYPPNRPLSGLQLAVFDLCSSIKGLLPVAAMLLVVTGAVIYAAGQMTGAETRARANVWATACLTGALIATIIFAVAPAVIGTIYGADIQHVCDVASP